MKKYIIIALIVLVGGTLLLYPLLKDDTNSADSVPAVFAFESNLATHGDEVVNISIEVKEDLAELKLFYHDSLLKTWTNVKSDVSYEFHAGMFGVGTRNFGLVAVRKDGTEYEDNRLVRVMSDIEPEQLIASVVTTYPHLSSSFTQGLEFYNGQLYEGTGDPGDIGATLVALVNLNTGEHIRKIGLQAGFFGEGITILNNYIYQLTYKNGKCYRYALDSLTIKGEFNYQGEGWGLCNDGKYLIMSNGSEQISFRDPESFATVRTIEVYNNRGPITNINELEYIDGRIYANIWTTNAVIVIDPQSGKVLQEIDATELAKEGRGSGEVLNGIAYNPATGKTYMTGKYWPKLFEVKFTPITEVP